MADLEELPPIGNEMLEQVTEAMVAIHEHYYHRKPASAHTRMMGDDMLACMFGGPYTNVEQTLIELQRRALVQESRSAFQHAMEARFMTEVQRITRRVVERFISTHHVGPDIELELFVLGPATPS